MKKKLFFSVVTLVLLVAVLASIKALQISAMIETGKSFTPPPVTITSYKATAQSWESTISAVGSFEAVRGVTVSAEVSGRVVEIAFDSGVQVDKGDLLVTLNDSSEKAQLKEAQAEIALAKLDLNRKAKLIASKVISQSDYDIAKATFDEANARAENIQSLIEKKHIRAPFSGRVGIREINIGQNLKEGDAIVTLQSLDPILVNFSLPQNQLSKVKENLKVQITSDAIPADILQGTITTISPLIDNTTRNIQVQATIPNSEKKAIPGMFANVEVVLSVEENVIVIPTTAIFYAPYGNSVFVIENKDGEENNDIKIVRQKFIKTGRAQGDFATVTSGLKENENVVSTGVFKLQNGQSVEIDNTLAPDFQLQPKPKDV
jgi:membrane fusion protein (multidrug efflux system)